VAIGSTCDSASHPTAFVIGILSGVLSVFGFAVIQSRLQKAIKSIDTCGVLNLHGWPGLMGGIAAVFVVTGIDRSVQFKGIGISIVIAMVAGFITGKILLSFGRRTRPYIDSEEFVDAEA
jgi:ammonium transporter Rh